MFLIQTVFFLGPLKHIWLQKRRSSLLTGLFGLEREGKKLGPAYYLSPKRPLKSY